MAVNLVDFSNDKYVILKILSEHLIRVGDAQFAPLSQIEIAILAGFSKPKANQLMQELVNEGYVAPYCGMRGKYVVTKDGCYVLDVFRENSTCLSHP